MNSSEEIAKNELMLQQARLREIPLLHPTKKSLLSTKTKVTFLNDVCLTANDDAYANDVSFGNDVGFA